MKEKVEFTLKVNDLASQSLQTIGTRTEKVFVRINSVVGNLNASNRVLGQSYSVLHKQIKEVERTVITRSAFSSLVRSRQELERIQRVTLPRVQAGGQSGRAGSSVGGSSLAASKGSSLGKGGLASAAAGLMKNAASAIAQGIIASINEAFKRQEMQVAFNGLTGSRQSGKLLMDKLVAFQKGTVLGDEVYTNARSMLESGFDSDEVHDNLKMLGQVSMGNAQKLSRLTQAFSQVRIDGRLTGNTLSQLIGTGFNPLKQISDSTGESVSSLENRMAQGLITFSQVQQSLRDATSEGGMFSGMLEQMAETPSGKMKLLAGQLDELKVKIGEAYSPLVTQMAELGSDLVVVAGDSLQPLTSAVKGAALWVAKLREDSGGWMDYVGIIKKQVQDLSPYYEKTLGTILSIVGGVLGLIANSEMLKDRLSAIGSIASFILNRIGDSMLILKWLYDNVLEPIFFCIENIYRAVSSVIESGIAELKKLYDEVVKPIVDEVRQFFDMLKDSRAGSFLRSLKLPAIFQRPSTDKPWTPGQLIFGTSESKSVNDQYGREVDSVIQERNVRPVNISIGKFLDNINLTTASLPEGTDEVEKTVLNMFNRVLAQGIS